MIKKKLNIILISIIVLFSQCSKDKVKTSIEFENNSNSSLEIYVSYNYPDTSLSDTLFRGGYNVSKLETAQLVREWKNELELYSSNNMFMLFVFDVDTMSYYENNIIISDYKVLKRYDLSFDELDELDWKLVYP